MNVGSVSFGTQDTTGEKMSDKKAHHQINVVRIEQVLTHPNADKLEIIPIEGYQAVVGKGQFKIGDLAYYIPPDSVVPDREEYAFLWGNATYEGGTPERKRRIGAKKLRGEWSEGVLMPVSNGFMTSGLPFAKDALVRKNGETTFDFFLVYPGDDVSERLGITHYNPPEPGESTAPGGNEGNPKRFRWPRSFNGWKQLFLMWLRGEKREGGISLPTYDVDAYKRYRGVLVPGENVRITEKIHGSNGRFIYKKGMFGLDKFYVGSRNLWKAPGSTCAWRKAAKDNSWIETWCRQHPGYALYGEVTPTQKGYDYGSGCKDPLVPKIKFHLFDIRRPDGHWAEMSEWPSLLLPDDLTSHWEISRSIVPLLYEGPWSEEIAKSFVDGPSTVPLTNHIREGIVIKAVPERTARGLGRVQLKIVSNDFLAKEVRG